MDQAWERYPGGGTMAKMTRRRWHTPDMAEAAGRAVRLDAIADGHDENADDCWQVWLDGLDEDEAGTLASDEEIRAAFARGWSEGRQGRQ